MSNYAHCFPFPPTLKYPYLLHYTRPLKHLQLGGY